MSTPSFGPNDILCVNTIRTLSIDAVEKANSGHPGLPLGAAPMAYVLWQNFLKHNPRHPGWKDRDRFILSAGHGSMLLYSLLHLYGYDLSLDEIKSFRQWESRTPGHPEAFMTPGVEATTGPLGQGSANAVGMAMAERYLANLFNRPGFEIVDHFTYALVSDGDLMEGISAEAASLAGHLRLGKLIYLYDSNDITLDGPTDMTFSSEDVAKRYESYGWQVLTVRNGDEDLTAIARAIEEAKEESQRPSLIIVKTTIGYGSPKAGTSGVHGSPLKAQEILETKKKLGWKWEEPFFIPEDARRHFEIAADTGARGEKQWNELFSAYCEKHPDLARQWDLAWSQALPEGWDRGLPQFAPQEKLATRQASGKALNAIAKTVPWFFGGDADLSCSTNTSIQDAGSFEGMKGTGRNVHYGVREHAMAAAANGIAYHGGASHYVATFFCFSDYMKPSVRLAALNRLPVKYIWTHDSVGLGEDGPTHQPIEHLMALRALPDFVLIRPADASETTEAWRAAMEINDRPVGLVLSRQALPTLDRTKYGPADGVHKGAYILSEAENGSPSGILLATGSEVALALEAQAKLQLEGISVRVVSMPSWELFSQQPRSYREEVLPPQIQARISIEAGATLGWERWIGDSGRAIGIDRFGASAPASVIFKNFGFTSDHIATEMKKILS